MEESAKHQSRQFLIWLAFILILAGAAFVRMYEITLRPMHNDEGVNHHFIHEMIEKGYYPYSHENYHGPAYFYITRLMTALAGESELAMRSSAILAGLLTILLLRTLRRREGDTFVLIAALLLASSASLVFYSRYAIHESLFLLAGAGVALSVYGYFAERLPKYIYSGFVSLAILIATKETFIVTLFCVAVSILMLGRWKSLLADLHRDQLHLFNGSLLAVVLIALCFTGGFQWPGGLREMLLAVPQWIGRNQSDIGHFKPFNQYIRYFFACEPLVLAGVLIGGVSILARFVLAHEEWPESSFVSFCGAWSISALLVYSFIKYKTPWLMINITLPSLLVVSWWLGRAVDKSALLGIGAVGLVLALSIVYTITYNFKIPYDSRRNLFSYVQTTPGMTECVADIETYWKTHPDAHVLIGVGGYWPLPYYFRNHANGLEYQVPKDKDKDIDGLYERYGVMILDNKTNWKKDGWTWKYYRLSDVQEAHVYFKRK